jgi:hypothetical protein
MQFELKNEKSFSILNHELRNYPLSEQSHILIKEVNEFEAIIRSSNPSIHIETSEGFIVRSLLIDSYFKFKYDEVYEVEFKINESEGVRSGLRKWVNIQYTNRTENIGQILHEHVLVPLMILRRDRFITHSSGVQFMNKEAVLFGGTGGVGKTSIEIKLCLDLGFNFVADDISVVDQQGSVYPNLNYPKIYAYNLKGNKKLKDILFKNRRLGDSLQWSLKKSFGSDKVRRKVDPELIYNLPLEDKLEVSKYYFLFRSDVDQLTIEEISAEQSTTYSNLIIKNEYSVLYNHLRWHSYNRKALGLDAFVSEVSVDETFARLGSLFFNKTANYLLKIPHKMSHKALMEELPVLIKEELNS